MDKWGEGSPCGSCLWFRMIFGDFFESYGPRLVLLKVYTASHNPVSEHPVSFAYSFSFYIRLFSSPNQSPKHNGSVEYDLPRNGIHCWVGTSGNFLIETQQLKIMNSWFQRIQKFSSGYMTFQLIFKMCPLPVTLLLLSNFTLLKPSPLPHIMK